MTLSTPRTPTIDRMMQVWFLQLRRKDGVTSRYASEFGTRDAAAAAAITIMERHADVFATVSIGHGDSLTRVASHA